MLIYKVKILKKKIFARLNEIVFSLPDFVKLHFVKTISSKTDSKSIVFVGSLLVARIPRMAKWINRQTDYRLLLVCKKDGFINKFFKDTFDEVILYRNQYHLKAIIKSFDPSNHLLHSFGPPCEDPFIAMKEFKGKCIYDYQDLLVSNFGMQPPFAYMKKGIIFERFLLENADYVVNHSLELQAAKKIYPNFKPSPNQLFFPNYTDNDSFVYSKNKKLDMDDIHLVYAGGIMSSFRSKDLFGGLQLHWLIEKLQRQKIHFHIYPSPTLLKEHISDYYELDKKYEYFHLHPSVDEKKLTSELSKYHFGILPFFHRTNKRLDVKRYYATTLKIFNFFEAALPVLLSEDLDFQNFVANKYSAGVKMSYEDFDNVREKIQKIDYNSMIASLHEKRELYSLKNKIHNLTEVYNDQFK